MSVSVELIFWGKEDMLDKKKQNWRREKMTLYGRPYGRLYGPYRKLRNHDKTTAREIIGKIKKKSKDFRFKGRF